MRYWDGGWGFGWLHAAVTLGVTVLVVAGLITAAIVLFRRREEPKTAGVSSARQILDERFARGEIDAEEYRSRRETLGT